jgi:hypothetical protein
MFAENWFKQNEWLDGVENIGILKTVKLKTMEHSDELCVVLLMLWKQLYFHQLYFFLYFVLTKFILLVYFMSHDRFYI